MKGLLFICLTGLQSSGTSPFAFWDHMDAVMKRRNRFDPKKPRSEESAQGHQ